MDRAPIEQQIVLCTVPDRDTAEQIATTLVTEQLAACVNIVPGITSVYRWEKQGRERRRVPADYQDAQRCI